MAFPDDPLDLRVEAYYGQWVDLSDRLTAEPVTIPQRGAPAGARSTAAGRCVIPLRDDDGSLTPLNPAGAWYPHVRRGAPIRVYLRRHADEFDRTVSGSWGLGWVEVGAGGTMSPGDYSVTPGAAVHSVPATDAYRASCYPGVQLADSEVRATVSIAVSDVTGGELESGLILRMQDMTTYYLARVAVTASDTVTISLHHSVGGELAAPVDTGITYTGQPLRMAVMSEGVRLAAKVWDPDGGEPRDWQVAVDDDTHTGAGGYGIWSAVTSSNTNSLPIVYSYSDLEIRAYRAYGTAAAYRPRLIPTTDGSLAAGQTIEVGGLLRRLERGRTGPRSALSHYLPSTSPVAWWPLEDGVDATQAASGLPSGSPMTVRRGVMDFVDDAPPGAAGSAHPDPSAINQLTGTITGASSSAWQVGILTRGVPMDADQIPDPPGYAYWVPLEIRTSTGAVWRIIQQTHDGSAGTIYALALALYATADATTPIQAIGWDAEAAGVPGPLYGVGDGWRTIQVTVEQTGGDAAVALYMDGELLVSATWPSLTIGAPVAVSTVGAFAGGSGGGVSSGMQDLYVSQIVIHDGATLVPMHDAATGFAGEPAADRVRRLCAEDGVPVSVTEGPDPSAAMGPQRPDTLVGLLRECEQADFGLLGEARSDLALTYRTGSSRLNPPVALTVDLSTYRTTAGTSASVLAPVYDDQGLRNQITATRPDGSSYTATDQASIDADGLYDDELEVNIADDGQLSSVATWLLRLGTVDEYRNPALPLDLGASPDLIDAWAGCDPGSRVQRLNPPPPHPPGVIDQIITGYSETLAPRAWTVTAACEPARPWDVAEVDSDDYRVAADGSTLAYPMTATDTDAIELSSTAESGPWTTDPTDYPLLIRVGAEIVEASGADPERAGATLYTWDADTEGWTGEGTTTVTRVTSPTHDGAGALEASKVMSDGTDSLRFNDASDLRDLRPGGGVLSVWVLVPAGAAGSDWMAHIELQDPDFAWQAGPDVPLTPGTWTQVTYRPTPSLLASCRALGVQVAATGVDGPGVAVVDTVTQIGAQTIHLSQRGVNGVQRAWPAGTEVDVAYPAIVSL